MTEAEAIVRNGVRFERDAIFVLKAGRMPELLSERLLTPSDGEMTCGAFDDPRELADGELCIVVDDGLIDDAYADEGRFPVRNYEHQEMPPKPIWAFERIDLLLDRSRLVRYEQEGRLLRLADARSVTALVRALFDSTRRRDDAPPFDVFEWPLSIDPTPEGMAEAAHGTFLGAWYICSCGDWGCWSDYVWIENHQVLASIRTESGGEIYEIDLLPHRLDAAGVAEQREALAALRRNHEPRNGEPNPYRPPWL